MANQENVTRIYDGGRNPIVTKLLDFVEELATEAGDIVERTGPNGVAVEANPPLGIGPFPGGGLTPKAVRADALARCANEPLRAFNEWAVDTKGHPFGSGEDGFRVGGCKPVFEFCYPAHDVRLVVAPGTTHGELLQALAALTERIRENPSTAFEMGRKLEALLPRKATKELKGAMKPAKELWAELPF